MEIREYEFLSDFNDELGKAVQKLSANWEGKKVDRKQCDDELISVKKIIKTNQSLIKKNRNITQTLHYIKTVKQLSDLTKKIGGQNEYFATEMKTTAFFFKNLSKSNAKRSVDTIGKLEEIEKELYLDTLAKWINANKVPIKKTGLSEEAMLELAPKLTYLDLTDGEWNEKDDNVKNCTFSEEFIEELLQKSINLNSLLIKNSIITGKALAPLSKLQALQQLAIENCPVFNQQLPELKELQQLTIRGCDSFNRQLPELKNLQRLIIWKCSAFNQQMPELDALLQLVIAFCPVFNQQLPEFKALQQLTIVYCSAFNKQLPELKALQKLAIERCSAFNKQLSELKALQKLAIMYCDSFNQPLPVLDALQQLTIVCCDSFDQPLFELDALQQLTIELCPAFSLFDYPASTALLILRCKPELFVSTWNSLSVEQQAEYKKNNSEMAAKMDILLKLADIAVRVNRGGASSVIDVFFSSIREQEDYAGYLQETIQYFPLLTSHFIQNHREDVIKDIKKTGVSFGGLSKEARLVLLPLFSPENIRKAIIEIPWQEREEWLRELIQFEHLSGTIKNVVKAIKEKVIDHSGRSVFDDFGTEFIALFQKIPLKTIAAFASDDSYAEIVLAYLPIMSDMQVAVVIPLLSAKQFTEHVRKQSLPIHKNILAHATSQQKELYLRNDLIQSSDFRQWEKDFGPELDRLTEVFNKESTPENYRKLNLAWSGAYSSVGTAMKRYKMILHSLEEVLSMHNADAELLTLIGKTIGEKNEQMEALENELRQRKGVMTEFVKKLPEEEELPEEFIDFMTATPMENPWKDAHGNVADKTTWDKLDEHPLTREKLVEGLISPDEGLKKRINEFKEKYPDLWRKAFE